MALSRRALERDGALWLTIEGTSMQPFLRRGDRVLVRPCSTAALVCGDLALVAEGDGFCLHRVLVSSEKNGRSRLRTKGDWCGRWDRPVEAGSVVGRGVMVERGARRLNLDSWIGRCLGIVWACGSVLTGWGLWVKWRLQA